jgi:RNA-binding protein 39
MNGFDLAGRAIRVGLGNDKFTPDSSAQRSQSHGANQPNFQGSSFSGQGGRGIQAGGTSNFDRAGGRDSEKGAGASALDDTDVAGVNFNNYSRDALMRKLARTDEPAEPAADDKQKVLRPKTETKPLPVNVNMASRCVLLRNMFDPAEYVIFTFLESYLPCTNQSTEKRARPGSRSWRMTSALSAKTNMAMLFTLH